MTISGGAHTQVIQQRREMVAQLRLRKLTMREIVTTLADRGIVNEKGDPWNIATVHGDIKAIEKEWQQSRLRSMDTWAAQVMAEYEELKRAAYAKGLLNVVRQCLADQRAMLGLDAPKELNVNWRQECEQAGINPDSIESELVEEFKRHLASSPASITRVGVGESTTE